jgi:hypothetical protein
MRLAKGLKNGLANGVANAAALVALLSASSVLAQTIPSIVIPGRPDVPVIINGVDASWGVVEGDYGLDRPIGMVPTVIYRPSVVVVPANAPPYRTPYINRAQQPSGGYFPHNDEKPGYGRLEVIPPPDRPLPPPAESFFQSWSSQSAPGPVTQYPPYPMPQILWNGGWGGGGRGPWPPGPKPPGPGRGPRPR